MLEKSKVIKTKIIKACMNYFFILKIIWQTTPTYFIVQTVITILLAFVPLVNIYLMKRLLDLLSDAVMGKEVAIMYLLILIGCLGIIGVITQMGQGIKNIVNSLMLNLVGKHVTYMIQQKSATLDLKFYDTPDYYYKLDNARRILGRNWGSLLQAPIEIIGKTITLLSMMSILISFKWWITPLILLGLSPNIIIQVISRKKEIDFFSRQISETRKISYLERILSNRNFAKEIRIFGISDYLIDLTQNLFKKQFEKLKLLRKSIFKINTFWNLLSVITLVVCKAYIALLTLQGSITLGNWQFYTNSTETIQSTLNSIFLIFAMGFEEELYTNILKEFLETKPDIEMDKGKPYPVPAVPPLIEFKDVSFSYPKSDKEVFKKLSFKINPGEKIALVGLNGSGKTTLIKLLTRLYKPTEGSILYDGVDISEYRAYDIYKSFGIVFQDFSRYAFSLEKNIGISNLDKIDDSEEIKRAAEAAGVDKVAGRMSDGYKSCLTKEYDIKGHSDLSGGEWQKVAIARAFFRNSPIVILDEPTSSLDAKAECEIYKKFIELSEGSTAILISHRLSVIPMVDRIFYVSDGTVSEMGTHNELVEKNGEYAELYKTQSEQYIASENVIA